MRAQSFLKHLESPIQLSHPTVSIGQGHEGTTGGIPIREKDLLEPVDLLVQRFGHSLLPSRSVGAFSDRPPELG